LESSNRAADSGIALALVRTTAAAAANVLGGSRLGGRLFSFNAGALRVDVDSLGLGLGGAVSDGQAILRRNTHTSAVA